MSQEPKHIESRLLVFAPPDKDEIKVVVKAAYIPKDVENAGWLFPFPESTIAERTIRIPENCLSVLSISVV